MKKTCVITGATSGIGYAMAKELSALGHTVILIGRNDEKGAMVLQDLSNTTGNSDLHYYNADFCSQQEIRKAAHAISERFATVDVLINNAAQWNSKYEVSHDGIERQFAVNHLAYFLLTHVLYRNLARSNDARVINIGSDSHRYGRINFENLNLENEYHGLKAYGQSKLANLLFSNHFHKIRPDENVSVYCVQPGLVKTDIGVKHTNVLHSLAWKLRRLGGISSEVAASNIIYLATSSDVARQSGLYWDNRKPKPASARAQNAEDAERLWVLSEQLCGIKDYFYSNKQLSYA